MPVTRLFNDDGAVTLEGNAYFREVRLNIHQLFDRLNFSEREMLAVITMAAVDEMSLAGLRRRRHLRANVAAAVPQQAEQDEEVMDVDAVED